MRTTRIVSSCFWCEGGLSLPVQVFEDPVMAVLFEDKSEPHAWRLAAFFVRHFGGEDEYSPGMLTYLLHTYFAWRSRRGIATVRGYGFHPLFVHHNKGKRCRLRGEDAGTHFTITHRDRWLQYMDDACTDVGVSAGFRARVMGLARSAMGFYGVCFERLRSHVATVLPWCVCVRVHTVHAGPFWDDREQVEELERQLRKQKRDATSKTGCPFADAVRSGEGPEGSGDESKAEAAVSERATEAAYESAPIVATAGITTGEQNQLATIPEARRTDGGPPGNG